MVEAKDKIIDEFKVIVTEWPARKAFKMKLKLTKILGPSVAEIFSGLDRKTAESVMNSNIDISKVGKAIEMLFEKMDEDQILSLIFEMLSSTRVNNLEINDQSFDDLFKGKLQSVYKILGFVVEVNFGSFFGSSGIGLVKTAFEKTQTQPMPQTS